MGVVFATGASQLETLQALVAIPNLPWGQVQGFHMDEYLGMNENHRASFRRYLRENLTQRVPMAAFFEIDGSSSDPERTRHDYVRQLSAADPQLCLLGIGENGHLAFNDPAEADFHDPEAMKVVSLDVECRQQQLNEGWFATFDEVPKQGAHAYYPNPAQDSQAHSFSSWFAQGAECTADVRGTHIHGVPFHDPPHTSGCDDLPGSGVGIGARWRPLSERKAISTARRSDRGQGYWTPVPIVGHQA